MKKQLLFPIFLFLISSLSSQVPKIYTIAGTNVQGYAGDGGPALAAKFGAPNSIVIDPYNNLFISDYYSHCIRKVNTSGIISTVAGNGASGYSGDGGPAVAASLYYPQGIATDNIGNLYICDYSNFRVRKVDTNGIITTFAGTGTMGFSGDGGAAINAQINSIRICVDANNNVFLADWNNNRIRKVDTLGIITTFAGTGTIGFSGDGGPALSANLGLPSAVAADLAGNIYINDNFNHRVRKVDTNGTIKTITGNGAQGYTGDGGPATLAEISNAPGITIDAGGNIFIADNGNYVIREIGTCVPPIPQICMVEVDSLSQNNVIYWDKAPYASADTFYIFRDTANYNYALIGKVAASALSMFTDTVRTLYTANGDPNVTSWRYKISYGDTCNGGRIMSAMSPWHQTIYQYNIGALFIWNHYQIEGQPTPVPGLLNYLLRRDNNGTGNYITAVTASASSTNINDPQYATYQTTADWRVETVWGISCTPTVRYGNNSDQGTVVKSRSNVKNNRTTGIYNKKINPMRVYPNPVSDVLNVYVENLFEKTEAEIYDAIGARVFKGMIEENKINIKNLTSGIYLMMLYHNGILIATQKISKE